jgi:CTP:molybdopterin cytidylyltransferase MocA
MGHPKALLPLGEETFLGHIVRQVGEVEAVPVVVVADPHGADIQRAHGHLDVLWARNATPEQGMLSSIQAGIQRLPAEVEGALIWPVDVPLVRLDSVQALLRERHDRLLLPSYQGRGGHPIWLPARFFPEVLAMTPEAAMGLRALRQRHPQEVIWVSVDDAAVLRDVDTPEDLAGLLYHPPRCL